MTTINPGDKRKATQSLSDSEGFTDEETETREGKGLVQGHLVWPSGRVWLGKAGPTEVNL